MGSYSEEVDYADARGNIGSIRRQGVWGANLQNYPSGVIDQLSFSYLAGTNKLHNVADAAPAEFAARGFNKKLSNQTYLYDGNGNISQDPRSGFKITYNHLNLPTLFEELNSSGTVVAGGKRISITYDGSGAKLKKTTSGGAMGENYTQYYLGGIEYRDGLPEAIYHGEGRVYNTSSTSTPAWRYEYAIRDHLGNTRLMFADLDGNGVIGSTEVLQENHYYPFGMNMEGAWLNDGGAKDSKYLYNGKELNEDFGLNWMDYGARWYDAAIARWNGVDPHAASYPSISPYVYVANNPINAIDPDGRDYILLIDHNTQTVTVKAVFYTQTGDATSNTSAQQAATFWNNNSGNFSYKVGKGKSAQSYTVNFDVQVQSVANPRAEASKDKAAHIPASSKTTSDGSSNAYEVKPNADNDFTGKNSQRNGVTKGGNLVLVKQSRASSDTGAHEVGHTLGVDHSSTGIMTAASNDPNRSNTATKGNVKGIIKNAFKPKTGKATGNIQETGTAPDKFRKGKVN